MQNGLRNVATFATENWVVVIVLTRRGVLLCTDKTLAVEDVRQFDTYDDGMICHPTTAIVPLYLFIV